jgi:P-type conjugative transfer protein TrbJ
MSIWSQVQNDINQVRNLANAASLLTGNSGLILSRLQQGYASQVLPQNAGQEFAMWSQTMGNASNSLGRTLAVQQQQQIGYAGQQQQIALQSQTAVGQLAAIQATNETLGLISTELNQAQTTLVAASQEVATRDAIAAERQGIADAYTAQFLAAAPFSTTGYPRY